MMKSHDTGNAQRIFIWLIVCLLPLIHSTNTVDPDAHLKMLVVSAVMLCFIVYNVLSGKRVKIGTNPLIISFGFFLFYSVTRLSGINFADASFEWLQIFLVFTVIFAFVCFIEKDVIFTELPKAFAALSLIIICVGIKDLIGVISEGELSIPGNTYGLMSVFGHRNLFAQTLFFNLPFTLYGLLNNKQKFWRLLFYIATVLSVFFLIILSNRATWIALVTGFILSSILLLVKMRKAEPPPGTRADIRKVMFCVVLGLIVSCLFYIRYAKTTSVGSHASEIVNFEKGSTKDHLSLWKKSLSLGNENPIFGKGLASWKVEVLKYGNEGLVSENNSTFYQTPHNDFLWVYCQEGFIGLFLYLLFLFFVGYSIFKGWKLSDDAPVSIFYIALLFTFLGYLTYSMFSFPKERLEEFLILGIIAGSASAKENIVNSKLRSNVLAIASGVLLIPGCYAGLTRYRSEIHLAKALQAKARDNNRLVISEIRKANSECYIMDPVSTPLTWYSGSAHFNLGEYEPALKDLQIANNINPYHIHVLNNLASCYEITGDHQAAIFNYRKAVAIAPNFEDAWLNLCAVYFNLNDNKKAYEALSHLVAETSNPKFPQFITVVLQKRLMEGAEKSENQKVKELLIQKGQDTSWYIEIYRRSKELNRSPEVIVLDFIK
ncbi:MAG: hypothetical protein K0Q95_2045 [Bacteroidota bacterium]|jgi:O-antigen ligase|nr:hypothetical protein [Bacteroidota bacterium]